MVMPLEGIKVLDVTHVAPAAFSSMFLGDMGAEVIKIHRPKTMFGEAQDPLEDERRAAYEAVDRNKKSIRLNLKVDEARQVMRRLAQTADVLIEGFRPGVAERLGIGYEILKAHNPRLVYCSMSGYGQEGPYADQVGHDINYIAAAGVLSLIGTPEGGPVIPSNLIGDFAGAGLHGVIGVLLALMAREKTGKGQHVDISYLEGALSVMAWHIAPYLYSGKIPERGDTWDTGSAPYYNVYRTGDNKYISIGCIEYPFWVNLCKALGHEEFIPHQNAQGEKKEGIFTAFRKTFLTKTRDEWFDYLGKEVCVSKVNDLSDLTADPQVRHRDMIMEVEHPRFGTVKQPGIPVKLSDTPGRIRFTAPLAGAHTEEILAGIGYSTGEIDRLHKSGALS